MAWSWSHTNEAYEHLHNQLLDMAEKAEQGDRESQEWLLVVSAEWSVKDADSYPYEQWNKLYKRGLKGALRLGTRLGWEHLAESIWDQASEHATCDNGGFNAWMCPDGCGCHTLSFSE